MKKLLTLFGTLGIIATPITSVVSCAPKTILTEQAVYNKMMEIASEPVEYNGPFLINYDSPNANKGRILFQMLHRMLYYFETSTNLINQLLTKIVYDRVFAKIPNIREIYPNFTLRVVRKLEGDLDQEFDNLLHNRRFSDSYNIIYNLHALDEIKTFKIYSDWNSKGENWNRENSNLCLFTEGFSNYYSIGEYLIPNQDFSFQQSKFIDNDQERLDFYMDLYQYGGNVKTFASDTESNSFNMFSFVNIQPYEKLPENAVVEIKNNPRKKIKYLEIIEDYVKNQWIPYNHLKLLHFSELGLIDGFKTDLTFNSAFTATEIATSPKLNYVYGVEDYHHGASPSAFYNGILIFDISVRTKFKNFTSHQKLTEKLYVKITH